MAERIVNLRTIRGLSQSELARRIGLKQSSMSLIESGATKELDGRTLHGLCKVLETNAAYIYEGGIRPARFAALTHDEREILDIMRALPPAKQAELLNYARYLMHSTPVEPQVASPFPTVPIK